MILTVYRGNNTALLGTTTYALSADTFYYIELDVTISDAAGTIDLYVNTVDVTNWASGLDTNNGATAWGGFRFGSGATAANNNRYITDIYVCDGTDGTLTGKLQAFNSPLGDRKV